MDFMLFEVRKKPFGTPFSVILERWWGAPNIAGPGKTFPYSSPLSMGLLCCVFVTVPPFHLGWAGCPREHLAVRQVFT